MRCKLSVIGNIGLRLIDISQKISQRSFYRQNFTSNTVLEIT